MLEEAAPLTEPPRGGWLGEWLLSVWAVIFGEARGTCAARAVTVPVACPGAGC